MRIILTLAVLLTLPRLAAASQIAIGIDWRQNVFVQEYWEDGEPRYAIYNGRPEAIKLTVNEVQFATVPGTESFRAVDGKERASWEIKGKGVLLVDAPQATAAGGLQYLRFRIGDKSSLGVLTFPTPPTGLLKGKIVSGDGINGSGGRRPNVSYEQDALTFKSEGIIEVKLKLPAGDTVTFKKKKSIDNPTEALISEAECATLPIRATDDDITIDAGKPLKAADVHVVTLRFRAPRVETPTMVVIDGWATIPPQVPGTTGGSYHAIRGIVVQPEK